MCQRALLRLQGVQGQTRQLCTAASVHLGMLLNLCWYTCRLASCCSQHCSCLHSPASSCTAVLQPLPRLFITPCICICSVRRPPIRTLSSGELAPAPGTPQGGSTRSAPAAGALQATASQAAAELELEVGTLEVLASMQAAAANSHRSLLA
jgi:hypothetical protein